MRRVLRYEVPADDTSHLIGAGPILMTTPWRQAASSPAGRLEVWVQVEASCLDGFLVWHLYEVPAAFAAEASA